MSSMLMILTIFNLAIGGTTTIALARQGPAHSALGTWPVASVLITGFLFWLANRLVNRHIPYITLLVTMIVVQASILLLGTVQELFDVFDGFSLLPWMGILLKI